MPRLSVYALLALSLGIAALQPAAATSKLQESDLQETAAFEEQRATIERELADGETYSEISSQERADVRAALERIGSSLEDAGSVASMPDRSKAQLFNDQELVNNILTEAGEDSRMVCERRTKTGSNRKITVCQTVAERRRARERAQDTMNNNVRASGEFRGGVGP